MLDDEDMEQARRVLELLRAPERKLCDAVMPNNLLKRNPFMEHKFLARNNRVSKKEKGISEFETKWWTIAKQANPKFRSIRPLPLEFEEFESIDFWPPNDDPTDEHCIETGIALRIECRFEHVASPII